LLTSTGSVVAQRIVRGVTRAVLPACLGVAGGLVVSWFRSSEPKRITQPAPPATAPATVFVPATVARAAESATLPSPAPSDAPAPRALEPPPPAPVDIDEEMRQAGQFHERHHEALLRSHANEPKDARWAAGVEPKLAADLAKAAERGKFSIVGVDCRTTSCVGVMEWPSYAEAVRGYGAAMRQAYRVNCAQEILLPPPPNPQARYQASMIFDCESWRADGN
jgi:hypothetical protein